VGGGEKLVESKRRNFEFIISERYGEIMNVDEIVKKGQCIGCMACISICPFGELETKEGDFGYPVPTKSKACTDCGICLLECPSNCIDDGESE
jgi:NAD-dependent dihydropyrimidine dehydrogenase PreA subunit